MSGQEKCWVLGNQEEGVDGDMFARQSGRARGDPELLVWGEIQVHGEP
jgi:hypothetical protein